MAAPMTSLRPLPPPPPLPTDCLLGKPATSALQQDWRGRSVSGRREVSYHTGARVPTNRWENLTAGGEEPRSRSGHTLLVHSARNEAVMFGGLGDDVDGSGEDPVLNDTWILNLASREWRRVACSGEVPPGVFGHTAELLVQSRDSLSMIAFGGQAAGGLLSGEMHLLCDVYGSPVWRRLAAAEGPMPAAISRWGHSMVALWEEGGSTSAVSGETVAAGGNVQLVICGGMGEAYRSLDDVISFDVGSRRWRTLSANTDEEYDGGRRRSPCGRRRHVAALTESNQMLIFGGRSGWNSFHNDLWLYDIGRREWAHVPRRSGARWPLPRTGHCSAYVGGHLYVFGGFELRRRGTDVEWEYMLYDDLWRLSVSDMQWEAMDPDDARDDIVSISGAYGGSAAEVAASVRLSEGKRVREEGLRAHSCDLDVAEMAPPQLVSQHTCCDGSEVCRAPRQRSMAAAFVQNGRLYVHGGRDKMQAFECFFSLPLSAGKLPTLFEHVAQRIADAGATYWDLEIPAEVTEHLDTLFKDSSPRRVPSGLLLQPGSPLSPRCGDDAASDPGQRECQ